MRRYLLDFNSNSLQSVDTDFLIIGGGIAGLTAALLTSDKLETMVLTKEELKQSSTWLAQGGVAAAIGLGDSPETHYRDTIKAGASLNDPKAVRILVNEGPSAIRFLSRAGAKFDTDASGVSLGREGGHSKARIVHHRDVTGSSIAKALASQVAKKPNVNINSSSFVLDVITDNHTCLGALTFDKKTQSLNIYWAKAVLLATGGLGQLYKYTTNPTVATGDGFAMAIRAGAQMKDMEFVQFHPTGLVVSNNPRFLISEALRGEGAYLLNSKGKRFMLDVHPLAELAPRDVVSRAIFQVMKEENSDRVFLDARHIGKDKLRNRFPVIWQHCLESGYELSSDLIPVAPLAHYMVGGVKTDIYGRTSIKNLFASGEVASSGVHGANRLGSNSLLEGVVFSRRIAQFLLRNKPPTPVKKAISFLSKEKKLTHPSNWYEHRKSQLKEVMTTEVGIIRHQAGLEAAREKIKKIQLELSKARLDKQPAWELANMVDCSMAIIEGAIKRKQSVGVHYRIDAAIGG